MKIYSLMFVAFLSAFGLAQANQQSKTAYISDELMTYMHSGPGMNYRIVGRVFSGSRIQLIQDNGQGFTEIKNAQGKVGWVESQFVTLQKTLKYQVDALLKDKEKVTVVAQQARASAEQYEEALNQAQSQLQAKLNQATSELKIVRAKYSEAASSLIATERALDLVQGNLRGTLWQQGAGIAGFSFLIGFIFAYVLRPRLGKKSQRWMS